MYRHVDRGELSFYLGSVDLAGQPYCLYFRWEELEGSPLFTGNKNTTGSRDLAGTIWERPGNEASLDLVPSPRAPGDETSRLSHFPRRRHHASESLTPRPGHSSGRR